MKTNNISFVSIIICLMVLVFDLISTVERNECIDVETNKTYQLGESWAENGRCSKYTCVNAPVPNFPNYVRLPTITKYICTEPAPPDGDWRNCHTLTPYMNEPYPKCCKHLVCNRPGYQQIIKPKYNT